MNEFLRNINPTKGITLTQVHYESNDYKNYPEEGKLEGFDSIEIKELTRLGFLVAISRSIKSPNDDFLSFFVSFDIEYTFIEPYKDDKYITEEELKELIIKNQDVLTCGCAARSSLIISQLSAQLGESVPIISPSQLMV